MKKVRVAAIGTGYIADYHVRGLLKIPGVEVVAACSKTKASCERFAKKYDIPHITTRASSLLKKNDIDAVIISTPNKFHAPYSIDFINSEKDVFIEKPVAMNAKEGDGIIKAAHKKKAVVMTGHMWRFDFEANYVREIIKSQKLGKVVKTKGYGIHVNWGPSGWFTDKKLAGGGALADMGVHAIDAVRYLMGDPKPKNVYAVIGTHYGDYNVDDTGMIMITWDNGAVSLIESGWWQPHMDGPEAGTRLYCENGYASLYPTEFKMKLGGLPGDFKTPMPKRSEHCDQAMYDRQMEHFIECVRKRKTPCPGLAEGQVIMKIVDAAYLSAKTGKAVKI